MLLGSLWATLSMVFKCQKIEHDGIYRIWYALHWTLLHNELEVKTSLRLWKWARTRQKLSWLISTFVSLLSARFEYLLLGQLIVHQVHGRSRLWPVSLQLELIEHWIWNWDWMEVGFQILVSKLLVMDAGAEFFVKFLIKIYILNLAMWNENFVLTLKFLFLMLPSNLLSSTDVDFDRRRFVAAELWPDTIEFTPDEPEVNVTSFKISTEPRVLIDPPIPTVWSLNISKSFLCLSILLYICWMG